MQLRVHRHKDPEEDGDVDLILLIQVLMMLYEILKGGGA
ncbi:unnamed protein product [[Actinomadura] parvosata subsp. kistnae]|nr:unnamed protein product [Actinomadura parvosata subsp. kistnae]